MKRQVNNDLSQKFNSVMIDIHWITATLITMIILASLKVGGLESVRKSTLVKMHMFIGNFAFILTIIRSYLLFKTKQPDRLKTGSKFFDKLAVWNHYSFYILLFTLSLTGIITVLNGNYFEFLRSGNTDDILKTSILKYHILLAAFVVLMLIMHIVGVLKHYIFTKENILKRIF